MSDGQKILVTGAEIDGGLLRRLGGDGRRVVHLKTALSEEELREHLKDTVAYLHGGEEYASRSALTEAASLKVIAFLGVGYESFIDTAAAAELGKIITNTHAAYHSVAEFTIGQIINTNRRIPYLMKSYGTNDPERARLTHNLVDRRIGIVGLGAIGIRIAEILRTGFQVKRVSYHSRSRKREVERRLGIGYHRELSELARNSDILVVMVPGNESTKDLIDQNVLDQMDTGSILINTARPTVVNAEALRNALGSGRLAMAAFDGFYPQEVGGELVTKFGEEQGDGRLLVTGHVATYTREAVQHMTDQAIGSILNVLDGRHDDHIVAGRVAPAHSVSRWRKAFRNLVVIPVARACRALLSRVRPARRLPERPSAALRP